MNLAPLVPTFLFIGFCLIVMPVLPKDRIWSRTLITGIVFFVTARYMVWRIAETVMPADFATIEGMWIAFCFTIEILAVGDMCIFFLLLSRISNRTPEADRHEAWLRALPPDRTPSVDVFIPTYNENIDVLERTVVGALNIDYPNFTVWVLDDSRRDWLREFCASKGVHYLRRADKSHAKAGNINNALVKSTGEFIAILDADFVPQSEWLYRVVGFFEDPKIGCVQTPQHFFNKDPLQSSLHLRDNWPDEQRLFFDVIMAGRDAWGVAFSCGSCGVLRRAALLEIGGVPTESVTEDILTTLKMYRAGYITRYLNERLSTGLAPETLESFFVQRQRWCRGGIQTVYLRAGPLGPGLRPLQRLFFIPFHWLIQQPARFLTLMIPIVYLWIDLSPLGNAPLNDMLYYQLPLFPTYIMVLRWLAPATYMPILSTATNVLTAFRLMPTAISSMIRPFGTPFKVTPKGNQAQGRGLDRMIFFTCIVLIVVTAAGLIVNSTAGMRIVDTLAFFPVACFWAGLNIVILFFVALMSVEAPSFRKEERFDYDAIGVCRIYGRETSCRLINISRDNATLRFDGPMVVTETGEDLTLEIADIGRLPARTIRIDGRSVFVNFETPDISTSARLLRMLTRLKAQAAREQRQAERISIDVPARCETESVSLGCTVIDLSLSGAQLAFPSGAPPELETQIMLELQETDEDLPLPATPPRNISGRVVRIVDGNAGIVFQGLNDVATARLDGFIEFIKRRHETRDLDTDGFEMDMAIRCLTHGSTVSCRIVDVSSSGAQLQFDSENVPEMGTGVTLDLPDIGAIDARIMRSWGNDAGIRFEYFEESVRDRLIQRIFTKGMSNASITGSPAVIAKALFRRAFGA